MAPQRGTACAVGFLDRFRRPKTPPAEITRTAKLCPVPGCVSGRPARQTLYRCNQCGFYFPRGGLPYFADGKRTCRACRFGSLFTSQELATVRANIARGHDTFPPVCEQCADRRGIEPRACDECGRSFSPLLAYADIPPQDITADNARGLLMKSVCPDCATLAITCTICNEPKSPSTFFERTGDTRGTTCTRCRVGGGQDSRAARPSTASTPSQAPITMEQIAKDLFSLRDQYEEGRVGISHKVAEAESLVRRLSYQQVGMFANEDPAVLDSARRELANGKAVLVVADAATQQYRLYQRGW